MPAITSALGGSPISSTGTPIMYVRLVRKDCARKLGRYWNRRAAATMRVLVGCEIASDPFALFSTFEIVPGASPKCPARTFRVTWFLFVFLFATETLQLRKALSDPNKAGARGANSTKSAPGRRAQATSLGEEPTW